MKIRKNRWEHRETLKEESNRHNSRAAEHPQSRRQMDEQDYQQDEYRQESSDREHLSD